MKGLDFHSQRLRRKGDHSLDGNRGVAGHVALANAGAYKSRPSSCIALDGATNIFVLLLVRKAPEPHRDVGGHA